MNAQAAEKTPEKTAPAQNTKAPEKKPEAKPTNEQKKEKPVAVNLAQLDKEELELQKKLEELQKKKAEAKAEAAAEVYAEVRETLTKFADSFTTEQKKTLGSLLGLSATAKKSSSKGGSKEATIPKFKLPEGAGGHTWSGRGRRSNEFTSWLETANGKEWTAKFAKGEVKSEYPLNPEWREANPGKN